MHSAPTLHYQGLSCVARLRSTWGEGVWDVAIELQGVVQGVIQNNTSPATYKFHLRGSLLAITPRYSNIHTSLACYLHTLSYTIIGLYTELWKILGWIIDLLHPSCVSCTTIFLTCFQQHKSNTWRKTKGLTSCDMVQGGEGRPNDVL